MSNSGAATGGNAAGPAGGELAGAYPNPTLAPAAVLARLESQFTGAVQLVMGTGAGAGALVTLANGYGITGFAANPPTPAVALTTVTSFLTANATLVANTALQLLSVSLGAGTWNVSGGSRYANTSAAIANYDCWMGPTTASIAGANGVGTTTAGVSGGDNNRQVNIVPFSLVLGATTTEFLNAESTQAGVVASGGLFVTANVATGVTCVRTA